MTNTNKTMTNAVNVYNNELTAAQKDDVWAQWDAMMEAQALELFEDAKVLYPTRLAKQMTK